MNNPNIHKILMVVFGALWAACEVLNLIPSIESNTVLHLIFNVIQDVYQSLSAGNSP